MTRSELSEELLHIQCLEHKLYNLAMRQGANIACGKWDELLDVEMNTTHRKLVHYSRKLSMDSKIISRVSETFTKE
jgi:hypothetical protein